MRNAKLAVRHIAMLAIVLIALSGCGGLGIDLSGGAGVGDGDTPVVAPPQSNDGDHPGDGGSDGGSGGDGTAPTGGDGAAPATNVLDIETLQAGDQIGPLTVVEVAALVPSRPLSADNLAVAFTGAVTVTGEYYHSGDFGLNANSIWFGPLEPASDKQLPRLPGEPSSYGFLVANYDDIKDFFGPENSSGTATVIIERYVLQRLAQSDAAAAWAEVTSIVAVDPHPPSDEVKPAP